MESENKKIDRASITMPCHWDKETIERILAGNQTADAMRVSEVYGVLAEGGPVGHGRAPESVVHVDRDQAVEFRKFLQTNGLNFTYLLNAPFRQNKINVNKQALDEYVQWILGELHPDALTITSPDLARYIRQVDPNIAIHISTIAGIKTAQELEAYADIHPNRIVPHHDCGKHWSGLQEIIRYGQEHDMEVEMLSTESCLLGCSQRTAHYEYLARQIKDSKFHANCNMLKLIHPREFLLAGGFIRPEDTDLFKKMGVEYFKISGRSKPAMWLPEVVDAYQRGSYDGNLVRLLGIDPALNAENWIYINNKALDGFLAEYPQTGEYQDEVAYSDKWITRLYKEGDFRILDGTEYENIHGELTLKSPGKETERVVGTEWPKFK